MFYFKFIFNFIYFILLTINILLSKNKHFIFLDEYINYKILFKSNKISSQYNNTISLQQYFYILDKLNL
jgi:hypothetical protein